MNGALCVHQNVKLQSASRETGLEASDRVAQYLCIFCTIALVKINRYQVWKLSTQTSPTSYTHGHTEYWKKINVNSVSYSESDMIFCTLLKRVIQFNSLFQFTQSNTIFIVFQVIYVINYFTKNKFMFSSIMLSPITEIIRIWERMKSLIKKKRKIGSSLD